MKRKSAQNYPYTPFTRGARRQPITSKWRKRLCFEQLEDRLAPAGDILFRINSGGDALAGTPTWQADTGSNPSPFGNASAAQSNTSSTPFDIDMSHASIPQGTPEALFQTERWDPVEGEEMSWDFAVTPGEYEVRLYFADIYSGTHSVGARVFDVSIEGAIVLNDYDIFAEVGGYAGVVKSFIVASDANLDIDFAHVVENPAIKAIEILSTTSPNELGASATSLDFGAIQVGDNAQQSVTVTNLGASGDPAITLNSTTISGSPAFSDSFNDSSPIVLQPGQSTTIDVTFAPITAGSHVANLQFNHSGINNPLVISLAGVANPNNPPVLNAIGNKTVQEGQQLTINVSATDPDGDDLNLTVANLPSFASFTDNGNGTGFLVVAPATGDAGPYSITVTATDDGTPNLDDSETFTLTVTTLPANNPPVLDPIGDQQLNEGDTFFVSITSSDPDNDNLTLSTSNLPSFATLTDNGDGTGQLALTPAVGDAGSYSVTVIVIDDGTPNLNDSETITIIVGQAPPAGIIYRINTGGPVLAGSPNWEADSDVNPSPFGNAAAAQSNTSSETISIDMSHASIPAGTPEALFQTERWDPVEGAEMNWDFAVTPGEYEVRLYFADIYAGTHAVGARVFDVSIESVLVLNDYDIYAEVGGYAGVVKTFTVTSDANLDVDFDHVVENPAIKGIEILSLSAPNQLGVSPDSIDFGGILIGNSAQQTVTITNLGSATDPDITINSTLISGSSAFSDSFDDAGSVTLQPGESTIVDVSFAPTTSGNHTGSLQINHTGSNNPLVVALTGVGNTNNPPVLASIGNQQVNEGDTLTVSITSSDPDNHGLTLSASDLPSFASLTDNGDGTGELVLNPIAGDAGSYSVTVTVTDDGTPNLNDFETITINVSPPPPPGVLYRINTGGPAITDAPNWEEDSSGNPSPYGNAAAAQSNTNSDATGIDISHASIPAGTPEALFQSERWDPIEGDEMSWDFAVTPGEYEVRLYFADIYGGTHAVGARVFDVSIEGALVLNDYDIFAEVGGYAGIVKSFTVTSDANLDIDFGHEVENPAIKAIEIIRVESSPNVLGVSQTNIDFGHALVGETENATFVLTNLGGSGDPSITIDPAQATLSGPDASEFGFSFVSPNPIILAPGQSTSVTVTFTPQDATAKTASISVVHSGVNSPLDVSLMGTGVGELPISFDKSFLGNAGFLAAPTSLQWGPDDRLYVSQQNGLIKIFTIVRNGPGDYQVTATETITSVQQIANHDDDGSLNAAENIRLVTGILVTGTAANPVIYVSSSDPRIGAGPGGEDLNLDTNSGIITRLTWNGSSWDHLDLVRGLPRSEENHANNGLQLDEATNTLYVVQGGNTNMGAPSHNFALLPEFALSAAVLSIDLDAIGETTYDLPTLDDEDRPGVDDENDPFGGNNGKNQAILVPGGPVQVYSPGFRNAYDLLITQAGRMYTIDNGPNAGWGDVPVGEGPAGNATNEINEPGDTFGDGLHFITGEGYYGGHPNPTRSNPANTFNSTNPQSSVSVANPVESDYLIPGVENGALIVYPASTNGLVEYTASNFGGQLQGDILAASFDNSIKRVKLNAGGDTLVLAENLFNTVGVVPLDITAQGDADIFPGTIWVADVFGDSIIVFEPGDCNGPSHDTDNDGYTNDDEIANGTNPCNAADVPPDWDGDFISNLLDNDDDNDSLLDNEDPFAIDADNGTTTAIGVSYTWENNAPNPGGLLGLGFTGLMTNGTDDYEALFDTSELTAGGAAGVLTIDKINDGDATGNLNSQEFAFQFGVNASTAVNPFVAHTRVLAPFTGLTPQGDQSFGLQIGAGDQDNYIKIVVTADNGAGGIMTQSEIGGIVAPGAITALTLPGPDYVDLYLRVDPVALTVQASYTVTVGGTTGPRTDLGGAVAIPSSWLNGATALAVGIIGTSVGPAPEFPGTWDFLEVVADSPGSGATVAINPPSGSINGSTFDSDTFSITNDSTNGAQITTVQIDLSTAMFPDMVFDPFGTAGDTVAKDLTIDSDPGVGVIGHSFSSPHDNGFFVVEITFNDFDPGETLTFSIDVDPTSIQGTGAPGPNESGSVSGLELAGSTVTVEYGGSSTQTAQTYRVPASLSGSANILRDSPAPVAPSIQILGIPTSPTSVSNPNQTVRITGPVGASVALLVSEGGLFTAGLPNGGFDIEPFEANSLVAVTEHFATIGAGGFVDVPITLTQADADSGINHIAAVIREASGRTGPLSAVLVIELNSASSARSFAPGAGGDSTLEADLEPVATSPASSSAKITSTLIANFVPTKAPSESIQEAAHMPALDFGNLVQSIGKADEVGWPRNSHNQKNARNGAAGKQRQSSHIEPLTKESKRSAALASVFNNLGGSKSKAGNSSTDVIDAVFAEGAENRLLSNW